MCTHNIFDNSCFLIHKNIKFRNETYSDRNINIFRNMDINGNRFTARNLFYYANEHYWHNWYISAYKLYEEAFINYDISLSNIDLFLLQIYTMWELQKIKI